MSDGAPEAGSRIADQAIAIIKEVNLPALIAGPAGRAISKLIGAAVDIPAAAVENVASRIRDDAKARSAITTAIANQAALIAANDPELVQRSLYRWLGENAKRQANREAIAKLAVEELSEEALNAKPAFEPSEPPDDWMNVYVGFSENVSDEAVQKTWAKLLAGEIRKPGSFSTKTLRYLSEIDQKTAGTFNDLIQYSLDGVFLPVTEVTPGYSLPNAIALEEAGLVVGASSGFNNQHTLKAGSHITLQTGNLQIRIALVDPKQTLSIPGLVLTRVGRELRSLIGSNNPYGALKNYAEVCPKNNVSRIDIGSPMRFLDQTAEVVYSR